VVLPTLAGNGDWTGNANGNWSDPANWNLAAVPGTAAGDVVTLTNDIPAATTVTLDTTSRTLGALMMGDSGAAYFPFTLDASGGASLTFDNTGAGATLTFPFPAGTSNTISVPITLNDNLVVNVATADTVSQTLAGTISGAHSLTKTGSGLLVLSGISSNITGGTFIENGILRLDGTNTLGNQTITLGTANSGTAATILQLGQGTASAGTTVIGQGPIVITSNAPSATAILAANPNTPFGGNLNSTITLQNRNVMLTNVVNSGTAINNLVGAISGAGDVYISCPGGGAAYTLSPGGFATNRFRFSCSTGNKFTGNVRIIGGGLQTLVGNGGAVFQNQIPTNSDVFLSNYSVLGLGDNEIFGALNGDSTSVVGENNGTASINLTMVIGANNHDGTFDGTIPVGDVGNASVRPNMPLSIVKIGTGTQSFNGNCLNTGASRLGGGTLLINSNFASAALTVSNGATLGGQGTLAGAVTILAGGILSPGASVGTLTLNSNLTIAGNLFIEVDKATLQTNDFVSVSRVLTNSGTGTVTLTNRNSNPAFAFAANDRFYIFNKGLSNGAAMAIVPATPGPGLAWTNLLAVDGSIGIVATVAVNPTNITSSVSGNQLTLSWPQDHTGWTLQSQTNSRNVGLTGTWYPVGGSTATNSMTFTTDPANPTVFFRLTYP
jgi:autotransporter-associated beta strand protein